MARSRLLDVQRFERRTGRSRRALRLDHQPQLRGPPGPRRAHSHHEPRNGRRGRGPGPPCRCEEPVMQPFTVLTAVAAPLPIAKIDTGMILPGRYMRRHRRPGHDYAEAFLYDLRFDDTGRPRDDFVLNAPAYRDARILVTDADFGCGSSREGAAFAVMDYGLQALVGPSFGEIFQVNCIQNGILAVTLPEAAIHDLWRQLKERPGAQLTIDLPHQTVIAPNKTAHSF